MGDIWQAARANNGARIKVLLDEGMKPDVTRWSGVTPLHRAAQMNSCEAAQVLIRAGASLDTRTAWGWFTPLHLACKNGHEQVAEVLLRAGAKWSVLTKNLQSPYDLAIMAGWRVEALRLQGIARKVAEERRIMQVQAPEGGERNVTKRASVA
ncbi:unnamed protein product, partial [Discosporangium mesarthrocarpum]